MPTRLLREGILTSERVNELDFPAEVFYRRLMSKVDDHGLFDARLSVLRASLYPLKVDRVREADISRWMAACQKAGLIVLYEADNKQYLRMLDTNWQVRSEPKYPLPTENNCKQPCTPVHLDVVEDVVVCGAEQQHTQSKTLASKEPAKKKHSFRESPYFDPFALEEKLHDWPKERVEEFYERMLSASDASGLRYFDWSAVATQWWLRDKGLRR